MTSSQHCVRTQSLGPYSEALIEADLQALREAYSAIGREDVKITTQTVPVGNGRVNLAFVINEGDRTKIANINFIGNNAYGDARLQAVIVTKETGIFSFITRKDIYDEDKLRADEEALRQFYLQSRLCRFPGHFVGRRLSILRPISTRSISRSMKASVTKFGPVNVEINGRRRRFR